MAATETGAWLGCDGFGIDQMMVSNPVQFFGGGGALPARARRRWPGRRVPAAE